MHDYRNHFSDKKGNDLSTPNTAVTNDAENRTRIAFYSELFSNASLEFLYDIFPDFYSNSSNILAETLFYFVIFALVFGLV